MSPRKDEWGLVEKREVGVYIVIDLCLFRVRYKIWIGG